MEEGRNTSLNYKVQEYVFQVLQTGNMRLINYTVIGFRGIQNWPASHEVRD